MKKFFYLSFITFMSFVPSIANAAVDSEVAYIFNSFSFLSMAFWSCLWPQVFVC